MIINIHGGTGIMGSVHKPMLESQGHKVWLSGRKTDWVEAAKNSDLTIITVPIPYTEEVIRKVAPYCSAIMDFTSVKTLPVNWMLENSKDECEVGGLHPGYKKKGTTMYYCPNERSGPKCHEIVESFRREGLEIKIMTTKDHDIKVNGMQVLRFRLFEAFGLAGMRYTKNIDEWYSVSTTQNKLLLDLIARQVGEDNDELFYSMRQFNPYVEQMEDFILENLRNPSPKTTQRLREFYGAAHKMAAERAARHLD